MGRCLSIQDCGGEAKLLFGETVFLSGGREGHDS
jgi:hypothetical protein